MKLTSPAFRHMGEIPRDYTCDGDDIAPPLRWTEVPANAKSLALVVEDPDAPDPAAPTLTWVHWLLYDLPAADGELPEAVRPEQLPPGTREGLNDWKVAGYGGPCPPIGRHRYFFRLYALDRVLPDLGLPDKGALEAAMNGHVTGTTELIGTYKRTADLGRTGEY